ncbi:phosphate acyltransferase PlsX [uncultured Eubacterium sp.]|uniref:phosphate acyltransferase PlsX n=1 Tax=uncultured Eubacterium sp. TaxID=165185 RepID=UPI0025F8DF11|nr:phosphate acyltransferase PlsX [uncultured Eubacterium sp.]
MKIIVDAMGGDNAPLEIIKGSMLAVDEYGIDELVLLGDEAVINNCVKDNGIALKNTRIVNCTQVIDNCDDAKAVLRGKPDSSMAVGFKLLNDGEGDAFVSAGNTGAITVGATLITKRIKGVKRPAIASVMPSAAKPFVLMDCGANAECKSEYLCQFGLLGSIYMQNIFGVQNPTVALANNGTEETKGTPVVKEAYQMMKNAPYNFIGNIEGRQIPFGDADVVVADGFTGNLILKTYEGVAKVLMQGIKDAFYKNTLSKLSYLGVRSGINDMKAQFDYKEYGGAVMLGVKKPVIKAHGSADARCFKNAIKQAVMFLKTDLINKIEKELQSQE